MPKFPTDLIGFYWPAKERADYDGRVLDPKTGELVPSVSMTKQSFKEECDINTIVRKFEATGQIDHVNQAAAQGLYLDLPTGLDLQTGLDMIHQAEAAFMALPANVRAEYDNDPVKFVEAFNNPSEHQLQRFIDLGLATRRDENDKSEKAKPVQPEAAPPDKSKE